MKKSKVESVNEQNEGINNINIKKIEKLKNPYYLFFTLVIKRLKEDKLYMFSFIVTVSFLVLFSLYNISEADGLYNDSKDKVTDKVSESSDDTLGVGVQKEEVLDIKDYIGIYSNEVILDTPLTINDKCIIDSYKVAYQIKKDKTIRKYFINDCVGTVEMWKGSLSYVSNGGARYISANDYYYLFAASSMKEVNGDTFKIDDDLSSLKNKVSLANAEVHFDNKNVLIMTYDSLYAINGSNAVNVLSEYKSNGGSLNKRVYKSDNKRQYNFIVFNNGEDLSCYDDTKSSDFVDGELYKIYTIKYNSETGVFNKAKEIISRNKSDGCTYYNDDIEALKE